MNSKNIITVVVVVIASALIVGTFIYFGGGRSPVGSGLTVQLSPGGPDTDALSRELLSALSSIKDLKLGNEFFKDRAFLSLIDYSKDLRDEPVGRENPFLP